QMAATASSISLRGATYGLTSRGRSWKPSTEEAASAAGAGLGRRSSAGFAARDHAGGEREVSGTSSARATARAASSRDAPGEAPVHEMVRTCGGSLPRAGATVAVHRARTGAATGSAQSARKRIGGPPARAVETEPAPARAGRAAEGAA